MTKAKLNEIHFQKLVQCEHPTTPWKGIKAKDWAVSAKIPNLDGLPDKHLNRNELREHCSKDATKIASPEACFVAVMSWGGMRPRNGRLAWKDQEKWLPIVEQLRNGRLSRRDAYERFAGARIGGLGPAFFTKLIFFLRPDADGYILDQWTGKSISILYDSGRVKFDGNYLSRRTSADDYEFFCKLIELTSRYAGNSPNETEDRLFSRSNSEWRNYVIDEWKKLKFDAKVDA